MEIVMALKQTQAFCSACRQNRLFQKQGINNLLHAITTLFLCGLWIPVWIIVAVSNSSTPYRCTSCGRAK